MISSFSLGLSKKNRKGVRRQEEEEKKGVGEGASVLILFPRRDGAFFPKIWARLRPGEWFLEGDDGGSRHELLSRGKPIRVVSSRKGRYWGLYLGEQRNGPNLGHAMPQDQEDTHM